MRCKSWKTKIAAFTLIELLVVIAVIALLVSILLPALAAARRAARQGVCLAQMQQLGRAHASYSGDFRGFIAAFNGYEGQPVFPGSPSPLYTDCTKQALDILAPHAPTNPNGTPQILTFVSNPAFVFEQFSHFVLVDYIGEKLPAPITICPEDKPRLTWSRNPRTIKSEPTRPSIAPHQANIAWYPFSASYQLMPAAVGQYPQSQEPSVHPNKHGGPSYRQGKTQSEYTIFPMSHLGGRKIHEVSYPSMKVAVADSQQRHTGKRDLFYAYPDAQLPLLFWDGSVSTRRTGDANKGTTPTKNGPLFDYLPDPAWESPTLSGGPRDTVEPYYKWTSGHLTGIDFGGEEIPYYDWQFSH